MVCFIWPMTYVYWPNGFRGSVYIYPLLCPHFHVRTFVRTHILYNTCISIFFSAHTNLRTWQAWQQTKCKAIKMVKKFYCLVRDNQYHNNMNKTKPVLVFGALLPNRCFIVLWWIMNQARAFQLHSILEHNKWRKWNESKVSIHLLLVSRFSNCRYMYYKNWD